MFKSTFFAAITVSSLLLSTSLKAQTPEITTQEVKAAQDAWGKALISISTAYRANGLAQATTTARQVLDNAYGYQLGPVLFKPTLAGGDTTFRTSVDGALAYFVGGNPAFPDQGFALKDWTGYQYQNTGVQIHGDLALTMGKVMLTDSTGKVTTVDKTWGFKKDKDGVVRIVLHHSSLPYSG